MHTVPGTALQPIITSWRRWFSTHFQALQRRQHSVPGEGYRALILSTLSSWRCCSSNTKFLALLYSQHSVPGVVVQPTLSSWRCCTANTQFLALLYSQHSIPGVVIQPTLSSWRCCTANTLFLALRRSRHSSSWRRWYNLVLDMAIKRRPVYKNKMDQLYFLSPPLKWAQSFIELRCKNTRADEGHRFASFIVPPRHVSRLAAADRASCPSSYGRKLLVGCRLLTHRWPTLDPLQKSDVVWSLNLAHFYVIWQLARTRLSDLKRISSVEWKLCPQIIHSFFNSCNKIN